MKNDNSKGWYNLAGIGDEGVEMLLSTTDSQEAAASVMAMELRARMNSHRRIRVYSWTSDNEVLYEDMDDNDYMDMIVDGAKRIY